MYLLYLDDSGSVGNASDRHIILAGIAVFERQAHWFSENVDQIATGIWPEKPRSLEFRGSDMFSGKKHWRGVSREVRLAAFRDVLLTMGKSTHARLFGAVIHKAAISPDDPMEFAFEQIASRFDKFLGRLHRRKDTHRGLIILDQSSYETALQSLAHEFRTDGHRWGQLYNMADVPLFVNSRATRMIQLADLIAYALRRYYENGDATYFDLIAPRFDQEGGVLHGLIHYVTPGSGCNCHACRQRRAP